VVKIQLARVVNFRLSFAQGDKLCEFHSNPASDSISFRPSIPLIPAKVSERSDAVFC
jgi:hypothetical protein